MRDLVTFLAFLILVQNVAALTEKRANPFLYAIKNEHGVSFLFGSIHTQFALNEFPEMLVESLRSKPLFVSEVLDEHLAAVISVKAPKDSVPGHLSTSVIRELKKRGIPEYMYDSPSLCDSYLIWWDFVPNPGPILDKALEKVAIQDQKLRLDLDDDEDIQRIFKESETRKTNCDIERVTSLYPAETIIRRYGRFRDHYLAGEMTFQWLCPANSSCQRRSEKWIPKIEVYHNAGFFGVVGVAHLLGPYGLLAMLEKRGFKVERVSSQRQLRQLLN